MLGGLWLELYFRSRFDNDNYTTHYTAVISGLCFHELIVLMCLEGTRPVEMNPGEFVQQRLDIYIIIRWQEQAVSLLSGMFQDSHIIRSLQNGQPNLRDKFCLRSSNKSIQCGLTTGMKG